jgi:hypothetical protein
MDVTISAGWWLLPAAITALAFAKYWHWSAQQPPSHGYGRIGDGMAHAFMVLLATVASLFSWLVWALLA